MIIEDYIFFLIYQVEEVSEYASLPLFLVQSVFLSLQSEDTWSSQDTGGYVRYFFRSPSL